MVYVLQHIAYIHISKHLFAQEWVIVAYHQLSNFTAISWREQLIFNEILMRSVLFYTFRLCWIFIVLSHWNNSPWIDMLPRWKTLSWFRANQSLLFPLNVVCLAEKQKIPIAVFVFNRSEHEPTIYRTRVEDANHYTTDVVVCLYINVIIDIRYSVVTY